MRNAAYHYKSAVALAICELGIKNQYLMAHTLELGLIEQATDLKNIDEQLRWLFTRIKQNFYPSREEQEAAGITHYIWRTQDDNKVRTSHAVNNGRIFAWNDPPQSGHPGEDHNCRCTAEPYRGSVINDPPIEPVYPELVLLPLLRISRSAIALIANIIRRTRSSGKINKPDNLTEHGAIRAAQRRITPQEAEEAIRTAKEAGNATTQIGKYGTPQIHYKGTNGITVIVETSGRNAGKIITFWRHN